MTTETVLTGDSVMSLAAIHETKGEPWYDAEYRYRVTEVIAFARAVEQAVLQSSEIQSLRKDAERYRFIRDGDQEVWCSSGDDLLTHENLDSAIDAAMEQKT